MARFNRLAAEKPEEWIWSASYFAKYQELGEQLQKAIESAGIQDFVAELLAAVISPDLLRAFKKKTEDFDGLCTKYACVAGPIIAEMEMTAERINRMSTANADETPVKPKAKAKAKANSSASRKRKTPDVDQ